ncbi:DNA polymerase III subunit delta [Methylophilaceae bacterium]|nr:DNA polymerase III subunit delta [Methylophilaceae bacterium]
MQSLNFSETIIEKVRKQGKNAILIIGEEPVVKKHIDNVIQKFSIQNNLEQIRIDIESKTKLDIINAKFTNDSLFSAGSILKITISTGKISEEIKKFLFSEVLKKDTNNFFIFYFKQNIKDFSKLIWPKTLKDMSLILEANEPAPKNFKETVSLRANFYGLSFTDGAIEMLSQLNMGNFLLVENELIKLQLMFDKNEINEKKLINHLSNGAKYDTFDLINASLLGNKKIAINSLKCLCENGVDPLAVNGLFAWIFKAIAIFKDRNQISPKYEEFTKMRIFGASQMLVKNSLNTLSKRQIEKVLIRIKNIDLICKGIIVGDPWLELNRLSFGLAHILNKSKV